jgi:acyl-CoA synthetase (AMP-forming)/AMP-acid ligase II
VPDAVLGQRVVGFVRLARAASDNILRDILIAMGKLLSSDKVPERLTVVEQLPRNARGRVDRNALSEMAAEWSETSTGGQQPRQARARRQPKRSAATPASGPANHMR